MKLGGAAYELCNLKMNQIDPEVKVIKPPIFQNASYWLQKGF